ncbi:polyprenyl synthetase family protein [Rhodohalobacter barkolensis]|uniref:Polyprenyl synthetase n=1 Tax=Rhodohalobacter barkolensis TaxID=2053187 RepID=A0A2N0VKJ7_9BACT|nr:polyprenyl synthetase family protein [Rhodohalobacter barkolensis]PKD44727.1 polyprenyl synthetase [Rhodohalobacter barkolensis]
MASEALLKKDDSTTNDLSLKEITAPIQNDLTTFRTFFKNELRSDVFVLDQIIQYLLRQKGKEIRPTLVFMTARMFGKIDNRSFVAATMIELLHTATLIHDDVVDEADLRRDFLSINKLWKNKAGVLLGDFLLSKGLLVALDHKEYQLLHVLSDAVRKMSEGELRQLKTSKLFNMTEERYFQIISEKTASLISACCECGAIAATDDEKVMSGMREIGMNIGIAFQIKDDLFDYGIDNVGKPTRNDIQERKVTLPLIKALEKAPALEQLKIRRLMKKRKKKTSNVNEIVNFVHKYDGLKEAEKSMGEYAEKALKTLNALPVQQGAEDFVSLIQFIINRKK